MNDLTPNQPGNFRWILVVLVILGVASTSWKLMAERQLKNSTATLSQNPKVDKEADKALKQMSDYLTGLKQFSYKSSGMFEDLDSLNKKQKLTYTAEVAVKRPNKMRSDFTGEQKGGSVYYDGKLFTVMGKNVNMYAQAPAPATIDQALDDARDKLGLDPPGADMLYTNPYTGLMEEVTEGKFKGDEKINGTSCNHLAFKGKEVDWEIWIEKGANPLPRKYLIVSKNMPEKPEFSVEFSDWKVNDKAAITDKQFAFTAPKDSRKITFMQANEMKDAKNPKK